MAFTLSRVDRLERTYTLAEVFAGGAAAVPAGVTGVTVALLAPRSSPTVATVWTAVTYAAGAFTVMFAAPDASSTDAVVVTASADLWFKVVTATTAVDAELIERITVLGGGSLAALPAASVTSVNGMTGAVVVSTGATPPTGATLVYATESTAVADANPQYTWIILQPLDVTPPAVPTGLTATPGNAQVILDWANNAEGDLARYDYRFGTTNPPTGTAVSTGLTSAATVTALTNGTAYFFQVRAVDVTGNVSAWSTAVSATPAGAATVPGAPTAVTGTAGNAQVSLTWTAPASDGGSPLTDYAVQHSTDGTTWTTFADAVSTTAAATVTGLTNGTAYTFRVAAVNAVGQGAYSTASGSVTPAVPTDPLITGRTAASVTAVTLPLPLTFTPVAGDDIFVWITTATGTGSGTTVAGFTVLASPANTGSTRSALYHRRWLAGDDPATAIVVARASASQIIQAKAVGVRNLLASIATATDLLATAAVTAVTSAAITLTLGPTGVPSQAKTLGLAFAATSGSSGGGLTANNGWAVGGTDATRTMTANKLLTAAAAETVQLGWTTAFDANGVLVLLKANA